MKVVWVGGYFLAEQGHFAKIAAELDDFIVYGSVDAPPWLPFAPREPVDVRHRTFRARGRVSKGHLWWFYAGLERALSRDMPDLIHVHSEPWGLLAQQVSRWARTHRVPVVVHGCDRIWWHGSWIEQRIRRIAVSRVVPNLAGFVAENAAAIERARGAGLPRRAVTACVHTNPRDPAVFHPVGEPSEAVGARRSLGLPEDGVGVGFVGRLVDEKGPRVLLEAVEGLTGRCEANAWFAIAGSGPLRAEVEARSENSGVKYLGPLGYPEEVAAFLRSVDVVVVPSLTARHADEQGPRVVIEAMLSGCVVVGSSCGSIPDMLREAGIVTAEGDPRALAGGIVDAIDLVVTSDVGESARLAAINRYSTDVVASQLLEHWEASLDVARSGP